MGPFRLDRAARRVYWEARDRADLHRIPTARVFPHSYRARVVREQLLEEVWGEQHFVTPRTVDVHIRRLREQIEEKPDEPVFLVTVRGFGYRFESSINRSNRFAVNFIFDSRPLFNGYSVTRMYADACRLKVP